MIRWVVEDHVGVVTLDRPPVNALDDDACRALIERFAEAAEDPDVRAVIVTGAGDRAFCAGSDIAHLRRLEGDRDAHARHGELIAGVLTAVYDCPVPVIAAVQAPAVGAGVGIVASCDIVIAAATASFRLPEIDHGIVGGIGRLRRLASEGMTRYLALTGESIDAAGLFTAGGAGRVVDGVRLIPEAMRVAATIAAKTPGSVRTVKAAMNHIELGRLNLPEALGYERSLAGTP